MSELSDFIASKQKYIKLEDGEEFKGYFLGAKIIPDKFKLEDNPDATTMLYSFKTKEGRPMEWTCGNTGLAKGLGKAKQGQEIRIKRIGMGKKTIYDVTLIDGSIPEEYVPF